jgi:predicted MPP superfamily phosphohydrolase
MYIMRSNTTGFFSHVIANVSSIGIGILLLLLMSTIMVDLLHFAVKMKPIYYGYIILAITAITTFYSLWNAGNTIVIPQEFRVSKATKETRIMQYTDVHLGHYWGKRRLLILVDLTKKEDIDAVVITGDLFDGRARLSDATLAPLKELKVPIYFVQGNHDGYTGADTVKSLLRKNGVFVLSNEKTDLGEVQLIGLNYMTADSSQMDMMGAPLDGNTIKSVLEKMPIERGRPSILLHHNPTGVEYASKAGIDLYLAGHTHAGQLIPITWVNKKMFKYNKGRYQYNGTNVYVSQGSGSFGPPMRLGTRSEITLITVKP